MQKKYVVRLTDGERETLRSVVQKLSGSSQKVRRAQVLLKPMLMVQAGLTAR